jgi:hypothetical protein
VVKVTPPFEEEDQPINELLQKVQIKVRVTLDDVLYQPWGHGPSLHLGNELLLGAIPPNPPNDVSEDIRVEVRIFFYPSLCLFDGKRPWGQERWTVLPGPFGGGR